jgi:ACT domain-containing protein
VTVVFAVSVTVQVTVEVEEQPDQEVKVLEPLLVGAVSVMAAPEL